MSPRHAQLLTKNLVHMLQSAIYACWFIRGTLSYFVLSYFVLSYFVLSYFVAFLHHGEYNCKKINLLNINE